MVCSKYSSCMWSLSGADIVGVNCHFDPFQSIETIKKMKEALDKEGLRPFLMMQPNGFLTPDASECGWFTIPEFPLGKLPLLLILLLLNQFLLLRSHCYVPLTTTYYCCCSWYCYYYYHHHHHHHHHYYYYYYYYYYCCCCCCCCCCSCYFLFFFPGIATKAKIFL